MAKRIVSFQCIHPGCKEYYHLEADNQAHAHELESRYTNKWKCFRHSYPNNALSAINLMQTRTETLTARRSKEYPQLTQCFWYRDDGSYGSGGLHVSYPGGMLTADTKDFPPGAVITVTVKIEVVLPNESNTLPPEI